MRKILFEALTGSAELQAYLGQRWISSSEIEDALPAVERPFGVIRSAGTFSGLGTVTDQSFEFWIHDNPGSYTRIDKIIALVIETLESISQVLDVDTGNRVMEVLWRSNSPDLFDDVRRTNARMASFRVIGVE